MGFRVSRVEGLGFRVLGEPVEPPKSTARLLKGPQGPYFREPPSLSQNPKRVSGLGFRAVTREQGCNGLSDKPE